MIDDERRHLEYEGHNFDEMVCSKTEYWAIHKLLESFVEFFPELTDVQLNTVSGKSLVEAFNQASEWLVADDFVEERIIVTKDIKYGGKIGTVAKGSIGVVTSTDENNRAVAIFPNEHREGFENYPIKVVLPWGHFRLLIKP